MKSLYIQITLNLLILIFGGYSVNAQDNSFILNAYRNYTEAAREVVYLHLNKSTYITGEDIGFTTYVLDKKDKKPSFITTNLYVSIEGEDKKILKQKLIKVVDGVASNTFELDSLFSSGNYKIKAYTNWMLNFDEKNYFSESIRILNPNNENDLSEKRIENHIDAQFLPESGHLLNGVINVVGVIIKDQLGFGIPYAEGEVVDKNNELLTSFKTNQFGIGKFQLLPKTDMSYKIKIRYADEDISINLGHKTEKEGIIMSLKSLKSKFLVSLITNDETLNRIKHKRHTLLIHNGDKYDFINVYFTDKTEIILEIEHGQSAKGINILTLFNENDEPISERLFFNYQGIDAIKTNGINVSKSKDSININLNFKDSKVSNNNSISVSILPAKTKSYNHHHNIISYTYLKPYINGNIEQAKYYFENVDEKKKYELDNLLITQGWSSYNWDKIFSDSYNRTYAFEQGITIKGNLNSKVKNDDVNYVIYGTKDELPRLFNIENGNNHFVIQNVFSNTIELSEITKSNGLIPANLYLQFFPNKIPQLHHNDVSLLTKSLEKPQEFMRNNDFVIFDKNVQKLDEVTVKSQVKIKKQMENELNHGRFGKTFVFDEQDENTYITLESFLKFKAGNLLEQSIGPNVSLNKWTTYGEQNDSSTDRGSPSSVNIFLNDMLLNNDDEWKHLFLSEVDFIEINRFGISDGMRSPKGFIKIYTKKLPTKRSRKKTTKAYNLPLTFSDQKKFYVPKYSYYNNDFYNLYGTIDWKPNLKIDQQGNCSFKIETPEVPVILIIEGMTENGKLISEDKYISLNTSE
ncbi:hypothetical protein [Winogradskyella forsetii]|uniref:hypothetical protein n=1 Tax=Winogradskyella forsetii TaxID=2686077 RepID=UPI0015BB6224|nr:hypothetical protein [Winogradskyella forsetii]